MRRTSVTISFLLTPTRLEEDSKTDAVVSSNSEVTVSDSSKLCLYFNVYVYHCLSFIILFTCMFERGGSVIIYTKYVWEKCMKCFFFFVHALFVACK